MHVRGAFLTVNRVMGQCSCRSNDSTDIHNGTQCILGYPRNPHQQWLWGGPVHLPSWSALCVVCPEAALMIVSNLTYAIVILMKLHGEAYHFTAGKKRKQKKKKKCQSVGRCSDWINHSTKFVYSFPIRKNTWSTVNISKIVTFGISVTACSDAIMEAVGHVFRQSQDFLQFRQNNLRLRLNKSLISAILVLNRTFAQKMPFLDIGSLNVTLI